MIEGIKLLISAIVALTESLPQTNENGTISDSDYNNIIADAVVGLASGAGFQVSGFTDAQIRGGALALCTTVGAWKKAIRS